MKKVISFILISLLLLTSLNAVEEEDIEVLPDKPIQYWFKVRVPEWILITFETNEDIKMQRRLEFMEKRVIEFEKLAEKFEALTEEHKLRYESFLIKTEERRKRLQETIGKEFSSVSVGARLKVINRMEELRQKFEEMKEKAPYEFKKKVELIAEDLNLTVSDFLKDVVLPSILENICGKKGARVGEINITYLSENKCEENGGIWYDAKTGCAPYPPNQPHIQLCRRGCGLPDGSILDVNYQIRIPACLCDNDLECPEGTECISAWHGLEANKLEHSICFLKREIFETKPKIIEAEAEIVGEEESRLSISMYNQNRKLVGSSLSIVEVGGLIYKNIEYIKLTYKVVNTGNIPLTVKIIEFTPQLAWQPASLLIQPQETGYFTTDLIPTQQFISLQATNFFVKAQGESPQLTQDKYPTTDNNLLVRFKEDEVEIVANLEGDLNMGIEKCIAGADFGAQQQEIEDYCAQHTTKEACSCIGGSQVCETCIWQ